MIGNIDLSYFLNYRIGYLIETNGNGKKEFMRNLKENGCYYDTDGKWYKGNLHMHTTRSDGRLEPEEAEKVYKDAGYDFIALTDHWKEGEGGIYDGMLLFPGCELDVGDMLNSPVYHIIGIGMSDKTGLKYDAGRDPQIIIDRIHDAGGIVILAHPSWSVTDPERAMKLHGFDGVEIYNTISGIPWNGDRADSSQYFDIWASNGQIYYAMAADDAHGFTGEQTASYIMVNTTEKTHESIIRSICAGNFYASQGPVINQITRNGRQIEVDCEGAEAAVFYSNCIWCTGRYQKDPGEHVCYELTEFDRYVRVELIGKDGKKAWSSPFEV